MPQYITIQNLLPTFDQKRKCEITISVKSLTKNVGMKGKCDKIVCNKCVG